MKKIIRMMAAGVLTLALAFAGVFGQMVFSHLTGDTKTVYGAQKLVYLNKPYVNMVPGDVFKLNLYYGKKNISKKAKWSSDKKFESDPRFSNCGALAPKSYADLMFLEHIAYHLDKDGRAAVLLPHGVLFRGNKEKTIRRYLIENQNVIDAIIGLPANCFHGTSIPVCCIVLKKNRNGNSENIWFCDASKYYTAGKNMNELSDEDIDRIVNAYEQRAEIDKFSHEATLEEIAENGFNCNICVLSIGFPQNRKENSPLSYGEFPTLRKKHVNASFWALPRPAPRRGGKKAAMAAFAKQGDPCRLYQGLPGCFASSVLSLDTAPAPG